MLGKLIWLKKLKPAGPVMLWRGLKLTFILNKEIHLNGENPVGFRMARADAGIYVKEASVTRIIKS